MDEQLITEILKRLDYHSILEGLAKWEGESITITIIPVEDNPDLIQFLVTERTSKLPIEMRYSASMLFDRTHYQ